MDNSAVLQQLPLPQLKNETFLTEFDLLDKAPTVKLSKSPAIKKAKLLSKISGTGTIGVCCYCFI